MMNALFLEKHTAGDRIDLPAIVNTSAVLDSQYSHCTINGNNTVWTAGTDVVFLNNGEDTVWQGTLPQGHTFLYRNGKNVLRSRWPENGYLYCGNWEKEWDPEKKIFTTNRLHLTIPQDVQQDLAGTTANLYFDWLNVRFPVTEATGNYVDLQSIDNHKFGSATCKLFFENAPVKYLTPGKWLPVPEKGIFYYMPLPGETPGDAEFMTTGTETLLTLDHAENIVFENITFQCTGDTMQKNSGQADVNGSAAIELRFSKNCVFRNCKFINLARWGILVGDGSANIRLENCVFENLGSGAIRIEGNEKGADDMFATTGVTVESCQIRHGGKLWAGCSAITIKHAAKNRIAHCDISYFPYTGISCGWTWGMQKNPAYENVIDGNHVHHLGLDRTVKDMGGIYMLGYQPGTKVINNHIHDIEGEFLTWGIYLDEGSSDMVIQNNLIYRCNAEPFHVHYGKNNLVSGNVFAANRGVACISVTRGTMDFNNYFVKGDKVFDFKENLCIADNAPFYMKYLLEIDGKEDILDSWKGDDNTYLQLEPSYKIKFADDYHCYEKTYREIPASVFINDEREKHSFFLAGPLPSPETLRLPEKVMALYQKYLQEKDI